LTAARLIVAQKGTGPVLVELSVVEQPHHVVMEVLGRGVPVTEVAERYGTAGPVILTIEAERPFP
jgi:hypothetical protein